uniref:transposase domain-containing protein n=1 Tax=Klebsiella quasipneumoniae TaxID=1463165 RepID=UPI001033B062
SEEDKILFPKTDGTKGSFGSDHGGERGALLYGLIGTCRLNGIDPEAYLRHILSVLPEWPSNKVAELLPWNVVLTDK